MFIKKWFFISCICIGWFALHACSHSHYNRRQRRVVRVWRNQDGCRFKRVIYPCYSPRGNLKIQVVRCPDGRKWRRKWLHPDDRCRRRRRRRRNQRELIP